MPDPLTTPRGSRGCLDGNEAVARVAHALSEVVAIYPITPASPMGEHADGWSAAGRRNLWGTVPEVIEMQAEGGAAGTLHGAVTEGALGTTFTASQGLLLMIPNLFKIAGELTPAVVHVAARTVATHALSIFGDHSDVMAARSTGCAMLCSSSVQEAHDLAAVAHGSTLAGRIPFLHFFDGFRTSHEIDTIQILEDDDLHALVDDDDLLAHRARGLDPENPVLRGSAQNPDVFFQAREAANPFYEALPDVVADRMDRLASRTGRRYGLVDYEGAPDAERVLVLMGSGAGAAREAVRSLTSNGERVGVVVVRLFRPFPADALLDALPDTTRAVAVLDRTKEPGAFGEPLFTDVTAVLAEAAATGRLAAPIPVIGGRYGLSSKEFTPAMVKAALDELNRSEPRRRFTLGITDDVTWTSLPVDDEFRTDAALTRAVFYALGSDGTVSANKSSIKIIGEQAGLEAQGYFVYDSRKAGATTVSHLRFGPDPIDSTYLVEIADFVACHQFSLLDDLDVLATARRGATFLLNAHYPADEVWDRLPLEVQEDIIEKDLDVRVIDAHAIAGDLGLGGRINTVMQTCFFALTDVLETDVALFHVKEAIEKAYDKAGTEVVRRNCAAVDQALDSLARVEVPREPSSGTRRRSRIPDDAPDFVQRVTARMLAGEGELLPVSALPVDGTFPTGTAAYEKRRLAHEIPIWDPEICIDCGKCTVVCPHAAIRMKVYEPDALATAADIPTKSFRSREVDGLALTIQVAPDDCTGCGICVDVCPAKSKSEVRHKAINMERADAHRDVEREHFERFLALPEIDRSLLAHDSVKGSQVLEPLFEFSGACAGCGETPYLKLLTQLFGERLVVANATGCSSIYGGNLPTTPWSTNAEGRGPAWSNSLFEDNAEFGLGIGLGIERQASQAEDLLRALSSTVGPGLATEILDAEQSTESEIATQRDRIEQLRSRLDALDDNPEAVRLRSVIGRLLRTSVWIVGGDGWAYDIGFGGLDHTLASGRDVNVLVLDTEVYSNTGGQASKATPRAAVAKFAAAGKATPKKDLGAIAMAYGDVYVAQIALGGSDVQSVKALLEADAWPGPSLVIAYSTCIAHGIDMSRSMSHQKDAVRSGYWPLYRFHPGTAEHEHPFHLDSHTPAIPFRDFARAEARFAVLARSDPDRAHELAELAQADIDERWRFYEQLAGVERSVPQVSPHEEGNP